MTTYTNYNFFCRYDDILKIYKLTSTVQKPILELITQINLQGAIWRTIFLPNLNGFHGNDENDDENIWMVAVATARKGIKYLKFDKNNGNLSVISEQMKYEGFLAYGLDIKIDHVRNKLKFATGYFDNHVIHVFEL